MPSLCALPVEEGTVTFWQGEETQKAEWQRRSAALRMSWEALANASLPGAYTTDPHY